MQESTSKQKILKNIRKALIQQNPKPYPELEGNTNVFKQSEEELTVQFAENFAAHNGQFVFCENAQELAQNLQGLIDDNGWQELTCWDADLQDFLSQHNVSNISSNKQLAETDAGITGCECLIARTGSILVSSGQQSGRKLSVFPPVHIVIATSGQLVQDIKDGFTNMRETYGEQLPSMISLTTGPSQTADIEKTLVLGAHGPKELYLFLMEDE